MLLARAIQRAATITTTILIGSSLCLAATTAQACDEGKHDTMRSNRTYETDRRDATELAAGAKQVASQATSANASASASASMSADGGGDCSAESSASAEARAGDEHERDYDSARKQSRDGGCQARAESEASARTGESASRSTGDDREH